MTQPPATGSIVCIGAANMDRTATIRGPVRRAASNPVRLRTQVGGVACNAARTLARLGHPTALIAPLGRDAEGDRVAAAVGQAGVDTSALVRLDGHTGSYTVVLDETGELVIGLADMEIADQVTPAVLAGQHALLTGATAALADANLGSETLLGLADMLPDGCPLFAAAVSPAKAPRLLPVLARLSGLFANRQEAAVLCGRPADDPADPLDLARRLTAAGPAAAFVTLGKDGAAVVGEGFCGRASAPAPQPLRDVNGAGDGFMAGAVDAIYRGRGFEEALRQGLAVASLACETTEAVNEAVSPATVAARLADFTAKDPSRT